MVVGGADTVGDAAEDPPGPAEDRSIRLHAEEAVVSKHRVETGVLRVEVNTAVREQPVEEVLETESIEVRHVPIGRMVDVAPETRQEDDVTIIPILEEVLVVERRLFLKEEVRIRRVRTSEVHRWTVQLREQAATITRRKTGDATDSAIPTDHQSET